ncbi:MAG TPA: FecR domain-containing protein [Puia sp.]|nr:FecR domain-containing protein [Puia sp.]
MDSSTRLNFLFERYLRRQCSQQELEELVALLQQDQSPGSLGERLKALWEQVKDADPAESVDWERMYETVIHSEDNLPAIGKRNSLYKWKIAAAVLVLVAGTLFYRHLNQPAPAKVNAAVQPISQTAIANNSLPGKKQTIHLPDGSTVILNNNSHLDYPTAFAGKTREVYLTGEAYFDIRHDPAKPFLVHAGKLVTRVLGTAFDIRAYPGDGSIQVTVTKGRVQVMKEDKSLGLITANQQISFSTGTGSFEQKTVDTRPLVAWKPEEVAFNDITMKEAARRIEQRFGYTVEFANPEIENCRVTATFSTDDMMDEILAVICTVTRSQYNIQNQKIIIDGKGCNL